MRARRSRRPAPARPRSPASSRRPPRSPRALAAAESSRRQQARRRMRRARIARARERGAHLPSPPARAFPHSLQLKPYWLSGRAYRRPCLPHSTGAQSRYVYSVAMDAASAAALWVRRSRQHTRRARVGHARRAFAVRGRSPREAVLCHCCDRTARDECGQRRAAEQRAEARATACGHEHGCPTRSRRHARCPAGRGADGLPPPPRARVRAQLPDPSTFSGSARRACRDGI